MRNPSAFPSGWATWCADPADAKALKYQSVCVRDPGRVLARAEAATGPMSTAASQALPEQEHRTAIAQLRVTLSRATETLPFVDVAGDDDAHAQSAELLKDAASYHANGLVEHFADDARPEERARLDRYGPRAGVATGMPGDAPTRRPAVCPTASRTSADASRRPRPRWPRRPACSSTGSPPAAVRRHEGRIPDFPEQCVGKDGL